MGHIRFFPKGQVPASNMDLGEYFFLNYEISRYQEIIETFRYEKPVYVNVIWNANSWNISQGYVTTNPEPVGEQEGHGFMTVKPL